MPETPDQPTAVPQLKIRDFGGFNPGSDPHDIQPGQAISQVNVVAIRPGEMRVRGGTAVLKFD